MKKILLVCSVILFITSCGPAPQNNHLTYQNLIILSDMSSRIDNKPLKDLDHIHKIVEFFKNECVKPGKKIGDRSSIYFSAFSGNVIASIDLDKMKGLEEKQQFINSTGKYKNSGFSHAIDDFEQKVRNAYAKTSNKGLDLISILNEKIENEPIVKKDTFLTDGVDTTFVNYENHIYVFTDGYLEYLNKHANNQFFFGGSEIDKVRQFCKANNTDIIKALESNSELSLQPNRSKKNRYINLYILETHERDKDDILQTYKYPTGQRDNEILQVVWRKWAKESGFKGFEWKKY